MKNAKNSLMMVLIAVVFLFASSNFTSAVPISGSNGLEGLGFFEGGFSFEAPSDNFASIEISLTNTSPVANGGYLTAFAFLFPDEVTSFNVDNVSGSGFEGNFNLLEGSISAPPYSTPAYNGVPFDLGGSTSNNWLSGGNPNIGLGVGESNVFQFLLSGTGFSGLSEQSFFEAGDVWFAARFRGFNDDGSDMVPAVPAQPQPIPEPATILLVGLGLAGMAGRKIINCIR